MARFFAFIVAVQAFGFAGKWYVEGAVIEAWFAAVIGAAVVFAAISASGKEA